MAGKLAGLVENLPQLACRALPAWFDCIAANQKVRCHAENIGERRQLFGAGKPLAPAPIRDDALGRAQLFGELKLGQARALSCAGQPPPKVVRACFAGLPAAMSSAYPGFKKLYEIACMNILITCISFACQNLLKRA